MRLKFEYKKNDVFPDGRTRVFNTPFLTEDKDDDWECAFSFSLDNKDELAFCLWHIQGEERTLWKKWFCRQNYTWEEYKKWLGHSVLSIKEDEEIKFQSQDIEQEEN